MELRFRIVLSNGYRSACSRFTKIEVPKEDSALRSRAVLSNSVRVLSRQNQALQRRPRFEVMLMESLMLLPASPVLVGDCWQLPLLV